MKDRNLKKLFILCALLILAPVLRSQSTELGSEESFSTLKQKELSFGGRLNTNGWSAFVTYNKSTGFYKSKFYQFELINYRDPKEKKVNNESAITITNRFGNHPKSYIFAKQNTFLSLHFSTGKRLLIGDKAEKSGVSAEFTYQYGFSLGLIKPYYLDLIYTVRTDGITQNIPRPERYSPENQDKFLDQRYIFGSSGFTKGLDEITPVPGLHAKSGLRFDWAPFNELVRALEIGLAADVYFRRIPIMLNDQNKFYFVNIYLGVEFGKRW